MLGLVFHQLVLAEHADTGERLTTGVTQVRLHACKSASIWLTVSYEDVM